MASSLGNDVYNCRSISVLCILLIGCHSEDSTDSKDSKTPSLLQSDPKQEYVGSPQGDSLPTQSKVKECETLGGEPHAPQDREPLDCDAVVASHSNLECSETTLQCGDVITARIGSGKSRFDYDFYRNNHCGTLDNEYQGNDAIYNLEVPAFTRAVVFLETPCAHLDLAQFRWLDPTQCPTSKHSVPECEIDQKCETPRVAISTVGSPESHLVVVDGVEGDDGVFRLSVDCMPVQ